jgi:hypothetical protein
MLLAILLALPIFTVLPAQEANALEVYGIEYGVTSNLLVNGGAELSARNFPTYGWVPDTSYGGLEVPFGAFSSISRNGKTVSPQNGSYFIAPVQYDTEVLSKMITYITSAPVYDINNLPGLIPGGFTTANIPEGNT